MHAIAHLIRTRCAINHSHVNFYTVKACYRLVYIFFSFKVSEYPFKQKNVKKYVKKPCSRFSFQIFFEQCAFNCFYAKCAFKTSNY